jgi:uncharacterized membrane protein
VQTLAVPARTIPPPRSGRARVVRAALVGLLAAAAVAWFVPWQLTVLVGWSATALTFIAGVWLRVAGFDAAETAHHATREDDTRAGAELLLLSAALVSLGGVASAFLKASEGDSLWEPLLTAAAIVTITASWGVVHTVFTLRYADLYYTPPIGGIDFKAPEEEPDYRDFAYTAFTVGMTFQVSDTDITRREIRRMVLRHALISFGFGAVILASTVNVVAGLLKL